MKFETLRLHRVTVLEDGVTQLAGMDLNIYRGEIMGLVGLSAMGRGSLLDLLRQNVPLHYGFVYFQEELVNSYRHSPMTRNRVSIIEERSQLVETLTVADNVFVLRPGFKQYVIRPKMLRQQLESFWAQIGVAISPDALVGTLTPFEKSVVELVKAVVNGAKLIVLKDVSNFISSANLGLFHALLRHYAAEGISFLYICNHHEEAFFICDRIALTGYGRVERVLERPFFNDELIMHYALDYSRIEVPRREAMQSEGIWTFRDVSTAQMHALRFSAQRGECVVLLDASNTILQEVFAIMSGAPLPYGGKILLDGEDWSRADVRRKARLSFIDANPTQSMLFADMSYLDNLCFLLDQMPDMARKMPRVRRSVAREYEPLVGEDIHAPDIRDLSPQSLYSLAYYRVHLYRPRIVFIVQPFGAADMYMRLHVIRLIQALCAHDITVVILAVNLADCLFVADRLLIVKDGRLRTELSREEFDLLRKGRTVL